MTCAGTIVLRRCRTARFKGGVSLLPLETREVFDVAGNSSDTAALFSMGPTERSVAAFIDFVGAGDEGDLLRVDVPSQRDLGFAAQSLTGGGNPDLELYTDSGVLIAASRAPGITDSIAVELAQGTYYVRVVSGSGANLQYRILNTWTNPVGRTGINTAAGAYPWGTAFPPGPNPPVIVPGTPPPPPATGLTIDSAGNSTSMAVDIPVGGLRTETYVAETLGDGDYADMFRFTLTTNQDIAVTIGPHNTMFDTTPMVDNLDLELWTSSGQLLAVSSSVGGHLELIGANLLPGTYYARAVVASAMAIRTPYAIHLWTDVPHPRSVYTTASGNITLGTVCAPGLFPPVFDLPADPTGGPGGIPTGGPGGTPTGGGGPTSPPIGPGAPPVTGTGPTTPTPIIIMPPGPTTSLLNSTLILGTLSTSVPITTAFSTTTPRLMGYRLATRGRIQADVLLQGSATIEVFRASGARIWVNTAADTTVHYLSNQLVAGRYFIRITPAQGGSTPVGGTATVLRV